MLAETRLALGVKIRVLGSSWGENSDMLRSRNVEKGRIIYRSRCTKNTDKTPIYLALSENDGIIRIVETFENPASVSNVASLSVVKYPAKYFPDCAYESKILYCSLSDWDSIKSGAAFLPDDFGDPKELIDLGPIACDILLMCATETEEKSLKKTAEQLGIFFCQAEGQYGTYVKFDIIGNDRILAVRSSMGPYTEKGSAARSIHLSTETGATGIISFGTAFGIDRSSNKIGDIIISTAIFPYDNRQIQACVQKGFKYKYDRVRLYDAKESLLKRFSVPFQGPRDVRVVLGNIMSGAGRMQCLDYKMRVVSDIKESGLISVVAGEMEGVGLLSGCPTSNPNWVVIKGISDFGDEQRETEITSGREIASNNVVEHILWTLQNG